MKPNRREVLAAVAAAAAGTIPTIARAAPPQINFSGYTWEVLDTAGMAAGAGPNVFSSANVSVVNGKLRLNVAQVGSAWTCAEVYMVPPGGKPLGYGSYKFTVATPADALPADITLGLFTWSDTKQQNLGEIDVELGRWGDFPDVTNTQFVVQPFDLNSGRLLRFAQPGPLPGRGEPTVFEFNWQPASIRFRATTTAGLLISQWYFSGPELPSSSDEKVHMNLWIYNPATATPADIEVVISQFQFIKNP